MSRCSGFLVSYYIWNKISNLDFTYTGGLIIDWDKAKGVDQSKNFRDVVKGLDLNGSPESWYIPFNDTGDLKIGLTAPIVELVSYGSMLYHILS